MSQTKNVILKADEKNIKKAKGVKKNVVKKQIMHEHYKETLFSAKQQRHGMNILRSEAHEIYGMHINKISLSPFDSKQWICEDGVHTKAYGYEMDILSTFTDDELREMEAKLSNLLLSPFDSKRWISDDGIHTKAYGYTDILPTFTDDELREMEAAFPRRTGA